MGSLKVLHDPCVFMDVDSSPRAKDRETITRLLWQKWDSETLSVTVFLLEYVQVFNYHYKNDP